MEHQHDPLAHIRRLPIEIKRDLPTLIVDRTGESEDAFMRTEHFMGHVLPNQIYRLGWDGMVQDTATTIKDKPSPIEPPHAVLDGEWNTEIDLTIEDANILGGNGRYTMPEGRAELVIPQSPDRNLLNAGSLGCIMVCSQTHHHPMGAQLKADDYSTLQTRYNERFTHLSCRFIGDCSTNGLPEPV